MSNIVTINKIRFAIEAKWKSLPEGTNPDIEAKNSVDRYYAYHLTKIDIPYLGLFSFRKNKPTGKLYSLASYLSEMIDNDNWIFVMKSDDSIYFLACRDGAFDINTDRQIDESVFDEKILEYISSYSIQQLYFVGNDSLVEDIPVAKKNKLDASQFKSVGKTHLLKDSKGGQKLKDTLIMLILCLTAIGLLAWIFSDYIFKNETVRSVTKTGPSEAEIKEFKALKIKEELHKTYAQPYADEIISKCGQSKNSMMKAHGFWERAGLLCDPAKVRFDFIRGQYGILPSEFSELVLSNYAEYETSFSSQLPVKAFVSQKSSFDDRQFIPSSKDELKPNSYEQYLDVLAKFNDVGKVLANQCPKPIAIPVSYLKEQEIKFSPDELWSVGSFTFASTNLSDILRANELFNPDYVFIKSISNNGKRYEAKYTYITLDPCVVN